MVGKHDIGINNFCQNNYTYSAYVKCVYENQPENKTDIIFLKRSSQKCLGAETADAEMSWC